MKKIILTIIIFLVLAVSIGIAYLNYFVIPTKGKAFIIEEIEHFTQKKAAIGSMHLNIFKGLVIKDLIVYDKDCAIISSKEVSFLILIKPFFKRQLIIPVINFESPEIFAWRRADNSINLLELFPANLPPGSRFEVIIRKIVVRNGSVDFRDDTLAGPFTKEINNLSFNLYFSLPASIRYEVEFGMADSQLFKIRSTGTYKIAEHKFELGFDVNDLQPKEIGPYYEKMGFALPAGKVDGAGHLVAEKGVIKGESEWHTSGLEFSKGPLLIKIDSSIIAGFSYKLADNKFLAYSGAAIVKNLSVAGIDAIGGIEDVRGDFKFSDSGLSSENISARVLDVPVEGKLNMTGFDNPKLNIDINSKLTLAQLQAKLRDVFKIRLPADMEGSGDLNLRLQYDLPQTIPTELNGSLGVSGARLIFGKDRPTLDNVNGIARFTPNQIAWSDVGFTYLNTNYRSSGALTNFEKPGIQLALRSKDIDVDSLFTVSQERFKFSKLDARYFGSKFSLEGDVDLSDPATLYAAVNGTADIDLADIKEALKKYKDKIDRTKPAGKVHAEFAISGNVKDIKYCAIDAALSSESLSAYNLKYSKVFVNYHQKNGIGEVPFMHAFTYGGTMEAKARIDLASKGPAYSIDAEVKDVKIEQLKEDTGFKDNDISGSLHVKANIRGYGDDVSRLEGSGKINISRGKLWQLNLFRGLGVLLFTSDFSDIIFDEGSCEFYIKDKAAYTGNLTLKSDVIDMYGSVKLDFQKSIEASLKAEVSEKAYLSGTRENLANTIGRYSVIEITGTLKEPKYRIKADVGNILEAIKDFILPN